MISRKTIRNLIAGTAIAAALAAAPAKSFAGIFISVGFAPPALPVYVQPICPTEGYLWTPGYWAYAPTGYYWVPGVWVQPPSVGLLWTPPYWGYAGGVYGFHEGYWGPHVGFYGGVNYGFGYIGTGFVGGRWDGGHFAYNTAVMHVGGGFHATYVENVHVTVNNYSHTSFNGGPGGIQARPSGAELAAEHENHVAPTHEQASHIQAAQSNRANFASANGGHPATAALQRPGSTQGAVAARGAAPEGRPAAPAARGAEPAGRAAAESRPAAQSRPAEQARPAAESRPAAQSRPAEPSRAAAPAARPASRPAPAAHAPASRPAPASHGGGGEKPHGHGR